MKEDKNTLHKLHCIPSEQRQITLKLWGFSGVFVTRTTAWRHVWPLSFHFLQRMRTDHRTDTALSKGKCCFILVIQIVALRENRWSAAWTRMSLWFLKMFMVCLGGDVFGGVYAAPRLMMLMSWGLIRQKVTSVACQGLSSSQQSYMSRWSSSPVSCMHSQWDWEDDLCVSIHI